MFRQTFLLRLLQYFSLVCSLPLYFTIFFTNAQELPPIESFTPNMYGAESQNWGISQSNQKNIYVANNGGLLEFNGAVWKLHGSPNGSAIRSVQAIDDIIFVGCYMEFGFWKKNPLGDLEYNSISSELSVSLLDDEEFWNIIGIDDWVIFQSLERIYIYNTADESIKVVDSQSTKAQLFNFGGTIYFQNVEGLFKIENGQSVLVSNDAIIRETGISGMFSIDNKPLLVTEKGDFFFLDKGVFLPWQIPFKDLPKDINIYSSLQLSDDTIVLGTISNGIYHIGKDGSILQKINQERGLYNNTVLSVFEDVEHNLWLGLDNGISVINIDSPFKEYVDKNGKLGVVYASAIYENYLYLGTNQGLFYKRIGVESDFAFINGSQGQVWLLKVIDEVLFCGHNNGTYLVERDKIELISDIPGTWDIKPIPNHKNRLLQGNFNGLSVLEKIDDNWALRNVIDGFDISSRFFEFIGENQVAVNREFKGIFKLGLDDRYSKVLNVENESSTGVGASLVVYEDNVLYTSSNGISRFDNNQKRFVADSLLTSVFYSDTDKPVGIFIPDEEARRLWCFTNSSIAYASPGKFDKTSKLSKIAIPASFRKSLGVLGFENLTPIGNERYLIGISNGYLTVDLNKNVSKEYSVQINSVSRKSYTSEIKKVPIDSTAVFEFVQNNLFFSYNVPEFDKYTEVNYQYQLEGIYDSWSDWENKSEASFENLPFGNYTFNVRAKVGNDLSTNVVSYKFRIERPWYLSNLAVVLFIVALVLLAFLVHKFYKRYYRKQREQLLIESKKKLKRKKLKAQKQIVQINNEKLKEEVASKNRELAISTMSIIKKNEFLSAIKEELKANADNPGVKSVIRTIDRNINNVDDWKFFEDAFNNADKDFLKKIKNLHPELTANDLRLCAYLRLNLSSKEMVPLLNISLRSVEVKRYRLRKKMNLPHEDGLADYIMEV